MVFDASLWAQPNPCEGTESFPADDTSFEIPDRPEQEAKLTRDQITEGFGGLPRAGYALFADSNLHPGDGAVYDLYSQPGNDVTFSLYVVRNYDNLSSFRLNMTMMVDYQPVEARYVRWNPERTGKWLDTRTTGINFAFRSNVEIVDVTLPGELFPDKRMYEIALHWRATTPQLSPGGDAVRFALYNGGFNRPMERPCAEPRIGQDVVHIEKQLDTRSTRNLGFLFFDGIPDRDALRRTIDVQPGETKQFYLSILRKSGQPNPTVLRPLLNGEPFGPTWWVTEGGSEETRFETIDARKTFEMTFPEEPGIYEVTVASWTDPYEIYRNRDGTPNEGVSQGSTAVSNSSNALRFRVVDPQSE